ncbi:MAG: hypothetical protein O7E51_11910 [Acidobacteria bacterium]|nr:hypothetical protein [Acidobacteriota bacterium]
MIRALDPSQALRAALILANHDQVSGPVIALGAVESYFEAARRQQRRIERAKVGLLRRAAARTRSLFDEVHFYLICWARIAKLTRFIAHSTRFRRTGLVLRRYHAELTERIDGRDHLEHFEERLPGGPRRHELAIPGDLLNMAGQFLTYGGRKIDVGPASVRLLRAIVAEFQAALLFDSLEAIAAAEPNRAVVLLQRAGSQVQLTRMVKQVEGLLGSHPDQKPKPPAKERASVGSDEPRR